MPNAHYLCGAASVRKPGAAILDHTHLIMAHPPKKSVRSQNILPRRDFARRVLLYTGVAMALVAFSLGIGTVGYHFFADLGWLDSFYNASMILTGMGPVNKIETPPGKLFSSFYALFSGIAFLSTVGIFFAPIAHRMMHLLHVEPEEDEEAA